MLKQVNVSFNFDPETELVSDVVCVVDGVEKKKKTTKKVKEVIEEMENKATITLEASKLIFNNRAVLDMALAYENRVIIKWEKDGKTLIPIIGKDIAFDEEGAGNKVTKSNTITYKGKANEILAEVGSKFTIEPLREGIWKLVSETSNQTSTSTVEEVLEKADTIEPELLVSGDNETLIDELKFQL